MDFLTYYEEGMHEEKLHNIVYDKDKDEIVMTNEVKDYELTLKMKKEKTIYKLSIFLFIENLFPKIVFEGELAEQKICKKVILKQSMKTILDEYYTHEAILDSAFYNAKDKQIVLNLSFCEWQLEELKEKNDSTIGISVKFNGVSKLSDTKIFEIKEEYILEFYIYKNKVRLIMDVDDYTYIEFYYKNFEYELLSYVEQIDL